MPTEQVQKLTFKKLIMTIGNLPSSYVESLSYYECMLWLCNYLETTVIPTVNNNGEAVEELQSLFIELKTYVDSYFENLDVQEEINEKLDEMAEDGSLTNLIKDYVDPIYEEFEESINNTVGDLTTQITALQNTVGSLSIDPPLFVDSTSSMTDTSKVYVLTSSGNIYTYNGTTWVDSGLTYGVNDLLFNGVPTAVTDVSQLSDFNNAVPNRCYCISITNSAHQPEANSGTLITFNRKETGDTIPAGYVQLFITQTTTNAYYRIYWNNQWYDWNKIAKESDLSVFFTGINPSTLTDLNSAVPNRCYTITDNSGVSNLPRAITGTLITFNRSQTNSMNGHTQYYICSDNYDIYYRILWGSTWKPWKKILNNDLDLTVYFTGIQTNTLTDLNNAVPNRCYSITNESGVSNMPEAITGTLVTFNRTQGTTTNGYVQYYFTSAFNRVYYRIFWSNQWRPWQKVLTTVSTENNIYDWASLAAFTDIGVIGDSYASGVVYSDLSHSTNNYAISWPQIMARKNGVKAVNFSRGGLRADTWLTSQYGLSLLNSTDPQKLYVVALGLNDSSAIDSGTITLGTISDINTSDPTQNANTFYGNMGKIISAIKTKAPNGKIIISGISYVRTDTHRSVNTALQAIATLFSVPYINPNNSPLFQSEYFTAELVSSHPTVSGYSALAQVYEYYINQCMVDNYTYFKDYTDDSME